MQAIACRKRNVKIRWCKEWDSNSHWMNFKFTASAVGLPLRVVCFSVVFKTLYGKHTNPELPSFKGLRIRLANQQVWICTTHNNLVPIIFLMPIYIGLNCLALYSHAVSTSKLIAVITTAILESTYSSTADCYIAIPFLYFLLLLLFNCRLIYFFHQFD